MSGVTFVSPCADGKDNLAIYFREEDNLNSLQKDASTQVDRENQQGDHTPDDVNCDNKRKKGMLQYYLQSASIHGVAQTRGPHFYSHRRPVWLILVIAMAVSLGWTLFGEISNLYEYPLRTTTRVKLNTELTFPAVTICNLNQYYRDRVPDIPIVRLLLFYQSDYVRLTDYQINMANMPDFNNMSDVSGDELQRIAQYAAPRLDELLKQCFWGWKSYNCSDLFKLTHTTYGSCFVFNGPDVELSQLAKARGSTSKLRSLIVIDNINRSYFSRLVHAGLKVVVHEPEQAPFPMVHGSYVRPGVAASMAISRSESKGLPRPYKAYTNSFCVDTNAKDFVNPLRYFETYSQAHCLHECLNARVQELCGCQHYLIAIIQNEEFSKCNCPKECESVVFSADVSYANVASEFIEQQAFKDGFTLLDGALRENVIDLTVYYKTMNVVEVYQEPALSLQSILGTLGGQMGLFLGASLLSITELVEFLLLTMLGGVKSCTTWIRCRCSVHPAAPPALPTPDR